jgi:hypothetical protein
MSINATGKAIECRGDPEELLKAKRIVDMELLVHTAATLP